MGASCGDRIGPSRCFHFPSSSSYSLWHFRSGFRHRFDTLGLVTVVKFVVNNSMKRPLHGSRLKIHQTNRWSSIRHTKKKWMNEARAEREENLRNERKKIERNHESESEEKSFDRFFSFVRHVSTVLLLPLESPSLSLPLPHHDPRSSLKFRPKKSKTWCKKLHDSVHKWKQNRFPSSSSDFPCVWVHW